MRLVVDGARNPPSGSPGAAGAWNLRGRGADGMPGAANRGRQAKRPRRAGRMVASPIADPFPTCLYCGKGITTGEPVIVVEHEAQRQARARADARGAAGRTAASCPLRPDRLGGRGLRSRPRLSTHAPARRVSAPPPTRGSRWQRATQTRLLARAKRSVAPSGTAAPRPRSAGRRAARTDV